MNVRLTRTLGVIIAGAAAAALGMAAPSSAQLADRCGDDGRPNDGWCIDSDRDPTDGDAGGVSLHAVAWDPDADGYDKVVRALFLAEGEKIVIEDNFENGRPTVARLWVGGSGPAVFYGEEDRRITHDETYDDGQSVRMQVCTSDSPNAICTDSTVHTGTT